MTIIGIAGTIGAGKGAAVVYLKQKGFKHYSARDFIVRAIEKRGMPINRDSMVIVANDLREKNSPSYIIESLYEEAALAGVDGTIESICAEGEVIAMKHKPGFYLAAIDADPNIRYKRITDRGNETDNISFEKFLLDEDREMHNTDPNKQNIARCMELADYRIKNDGTLDNLYVQIDAMLNDIKTKRPA